MSILNEPSDGTLSILLALRGALRAYGPMPSDRLLSLCAPETVAQGDERPRFTLQRWIQLGAMKEENGRVVLAEELATDETDQLSALRGALLDIVLRPANCPPKKKGHDGDSESRARDFVTAACWCLLQDPYAFESNYETYVHRRQDDQGFKAVQNDVRWNGFVRWSAFLGLALHVKGGILLNPAVAVRRAAREILPAGERQELGAFLQKLAVRVPVLPGGVSSAQVLREIKTPWRTYESFEVAPTTGLGLLQLRESGDIRLTALSDANVLKFLGRGGRTVEEFTHVERVS